MLILVSHAPCRFPSSAKASKQGKSEATPAKGSLMSGKLSPPQAGSPAQPQSEVDLVCLCLGFLFSSFIMIDEIPDHLFNF
jgi:hypothetical protein